MAHLLHTYSNTPELLTDLEAVTRTAGTITIRVPLPAVRRCVVSTPDVTFRAVLPTSTPDRERATVIVTCQGQDADGRVWVTFAGAWVTTAVTTDADAEQLERLVSDARRARR